LIILSHQQGLIINVAGDVDKVVVVSENTTIIEQLYKVLGGNIKVIHKKA